LWFIVTEVIDDIVQLAGSGSAVMVEMVNFNINTTPQNNFNGSPIKYLSSVCSRPVVTISFISAPLK
jgi:hypothetical protein